MKKLVHSNFLIELIEFVIFFIRHRTRQKIRVAANPEGDDFLIIVSGGAKGGRKIYAFLATLLLSITGL